MLEVGQIICSKDISGEEYFVVVETGHRPLLEKLDDFIIRNFVVCEPSTGDFYTLAELIAREKDKIIRNRKVEIDVYRN
jgi:hypothetical protein